MSNILDKLYNSQYNTDQKNWFKNKQRTKNAKEWLIEIFQSFIAYLKNIPCD